jgi:(2S)-methylsuccinyl-CoA dehydrogenase
MSATELSLEDIRPLVSAAQDLVARTLEKTRALTGGPGGIDDHQVVAERAAYAATEARAAAELLLTAESAPSPEMTRLAAAGVGELVINLRNRIDALLPDIGLSETDIEETFGASLRGTLRSACSQELLCKVGEGAIESRGRLDWPMDDVLMQVRDSVREFADAEIAPEAERIHRNDDSIPEAFIEKMGELGYFGMSIPEEFGGHDMGMLAMVLITEELSRASLAAAGSLITRPEILSKALLKGGTQDQQAHWLPKIAAGELMVAISVTEPDIGSDVASLKCRATPATVDGEAGYVLNGPKAWCTFAGRADIIALLARTDPDPTMKAKGLSLFIVPKDSFSGHDFEMTQPSGGRIVGKADATPGYRGMHSFSLNLENYFVPADHLVGGENGLGQGFYLQMAGFAAGRLQTGGRATGLCQAALEKTAEYVVDRNQFGRPISEFQLTQYLVGRMAAKLAGARAISYAAAEEMEADERKASLVAAQAKLLACDVAVEVAQQGQLLHGGWGYAEEYPISRYVADSNVLPIFEGVKPILELKVIARALLAS